MPTSRIVASCSAVSTPSATMVAFHLGGELLERAQDGVGRVVKGDALDQRQVDLHDLEADLAEQAQAGVAGTHVVGGQASPPLPGRP